MRKPPLLVLTLILHATMSEPVSARSDDIDFAIGLERACFHGLADQIFSQLLEKTGSENEEHRLRLEMVYARYISGRTGAAASLTELIPHLDWLVRNNTRSYSELGFARMTLRMLEELVGTAVEADPALRACDLVLRIGGPLRNEVYDEFEEWTGDYPNPIVVSLYALRDSNP